MKKFTKIIVALVILAAISVGFYFWHISEMDSLKLSEQAAKDALMAERIQLINDNDSANGENQTLRDKIANLENRIEELLIEEEIIFDPPTPNSFFILQ